MLQYMNAKLIFKTALMNAKLIFKTALMTALLVLLLLISWHNRTPVDFNLLPISKESFYGPVALMGFVFFGLGILMGLVMSIRTQRTPKGSPGAPGASPGNPWMSEPRVGSRIS